MTPTSYLELINAFKTLLQKKQDETFTAKIRYVTGLEKLQFAASQVRNEPLSPQLVESLKRESRVMVFLIERVYLNCIRHLCALPCVLAM